MRHPKKFISLLIALIVPFALVSTANAADETVTASTTLTPKKGKFFKEVTVASELKVNVETNTPPTSPKVNPMKNVKITFPAGFTFRPNNAKTPVCTDAKLNPQSELGSPPAVYQSCKNSVVGTGTAAIFIAKINQPTALISDPILIAFNAGKDNKGRPKIKIYGWSSTTNVGILMQGTLNGTTLDIAVPVLSNDSAVKRFELNLPGGELDRTSDPKIGFKVKGLDPTYVQARCPSSPMKTRATFQLGERDYPSGIPIGPTTTVSSPQTTQNCSGQAGKAKLRAMKVTGPNAVKNGRMGKFRVVVRNNGTATAKNVVVTSNRGGKRSIGKIAPGAQKAAVLKVKIRGKKNSRVNVRFVAKSGNVTAAINKKVRVK